MTIKAQFNPSTGLGSFNAATGKGQVFSFSCGVCTNPIDAVRVQVSAFDFCCSPPITTPSGLGGLNDYREYLDASADADEVLPLVLSTPTFCRFEKDIDFSGNWRSWSGNDCGDGTSTDHILTSARLTYAVGLSSSTFGFSASGPDIPLRTYRILFASSTATGSEDEENDCIDLRNNWVISQTCTSTLLTTWRHAQDASILAESV